MISDTAASFIVLQKDFADILWVVFPSMIVLKLLLFSVTAEGGRGILHLAQGCLYSVVVLAIFNYFYPSFIGLIDGYIDIQPVSFKSDTFEDRVWNLLGDYGISFFAILMHSLSTSVMLMLLTIVTVSFSISYALLTVFDFDGLWKITVKCGLAVILWAGTMYFIRFDISDSVGITDENAASYFSSVCGAACLSLVTMSLAFKYNSVVKRAKNYMSDLKNKFDYEARRNQAERDIAEGRVSTDSFGRTVFKKDYSDPEGDALRAHQEKLIRNNPDIAKKHGFKVQNWQSFEDEVKESNQQVRGPSSQFEQEYAQEGFKDSGFISQHREQRLDTISIPEIKSAARKVVSTKEKTALSISDSNLKSSTSINRTGKAYRSHKVQDGLEGTKVKTTQDFKIGRHTIRSEKTTKNYSRDVLQNDYENLIEQEMKKESADRRGD